MWFSIAMLVYQRVLWFHGIGEYPLVNVYKKLLKIAIVIVSFPINSMVIFQFAMWKHWPGRVTRCSFHSLPRTMLVDPLQNKTLSRMYGIILLVVLTILKNISQWEGLSHILSKIKNVPNHQPVMVTHLHSNMNKTVCIALQIEVWTSTSSPHLRA